MEFSQEELDKLSLADLYAMVIFYETHNRLDRVSKFITMVCYGEITHREGKIFKTNEENYGL